MDILKIQNYTNGENCYIVKNGDGAIVIDPGVGADEIYSRTKGTQIKYVLLTHCHYDHIVGVNELLEKGAELCASRKCADNIADRNKNLTMSGLGYVIELKNTDIILSEDEDITLCGMKVRTIETPGHTECSCCFLIEDHLFSGDTLFLRSVGRWDLPTGSSEELRKSIINKIYTMDEKITVHPGHGEDTDIGYEKKFNLCIRGI